MSRLTKGVLIAVLGVVTLLALAFTGCGGGSTKQLTTATTASAFKQTGAEYVGMAACRSCHANITDEYKATKKGDGVSTRHNNWNAADASNCTQCHVTGLGEPGGMVMAQYNDPNMDHLKGLGCETCHGPGSKHIAGHGDPTQITATPPARETCMLCHADRPRKGVDAAEVFITADTVKATAPGSLRGPHHAAGTFLLGREGFGMTKAMPSPHATLPNTCVDCHKGDKDPNLADASAPTGGAVSHGKLVWGDPAVAEAEEPNLDTSRPECASCHNTRGENLVQMGVKEMLIELGGKQTNGEPNETPSNAAGCLLGDYYVNNGIAALYTTTPDDPKVVAYKKARWNYVYVATDGSHGVHNPAFAKKLLEDAEAALK